MLNLRRGVPLWVIALVFGASLLPGCLSGVNSRADTRILPIAPANTCLVAPDEIISSINPLVYGVNHGPWAVITDITLPLAQEAGITMIRFPGGEWGDENDLRPYHIDQFVMLARQMGSEVSLNVRLLGGSPEKAAALVQYANIDNDYDIRYWGIGNEPTLYATGRGDPEYGVEQFNQDWRAIAEAMRAVDESILLIGPELHQFAADYDRTPKDPFGLDWMTEFLKANGDLVDIVSIHRYPFPQTFVGGTASVDELMAASQEWDAIIPYLRGLILETTGEDLPIAVTEVNSHWSNSLGGEATPDSFMNAIWWADSLGRMIKNQVAIVNYFSLQSQVSIGGYGLFARSAPRPTYYVYKIYRLFGDTSVHSVCDHPDLSVYASTDPEGGLTIILVNLGAADVTRRIQIEDKNYTPVSAFRFDEVDLLHTLPLPAAETLDELLIPGYTITLLQFE